MVMSNNIVHETEKRRLRRLLGKMERGLPLIFMVFHYHPKAKAIRN